MCRLRKRRAANVRVVVSQIDGDQAITAAAVVSAHHGLLDHAALGGKHQVLVGGELAAADDTRDLLAFLKGQQVDDRCAVIAGALRYPRYRWYDRFMIKLIMKMSGGETDTRKEVVYTDWEQVANFAREIAHLTDKPTLK